MTEKAEMLTNEASVNCLRIYYTVYNTMHMRFDTGDE